MPRLAFWALAARVETRRLFAFGGEREDVVRTARKVKVVDEQLVGRADRERKIRAVSRFVARFAQFSPRAVVLVHSGLFLAVQVDVFGRVDREVFDVPGTREGQFALHDARFIEALHTVVVAHIHRARRVHGDRATGQPFKLARARAFCAERQEEFPLRAELLHAVVAYVKHVYVAL